MDCHLLHLYFHACLLSIDIMLTSISRYISYSDTRLIRYLTHPFIRPFH